MLDHLLNPPCESEIIVYCPLCKEEATMNRKLQIECITCNQCFEEAYRDYDYNEGEFAYGY